MPEEISIEQMMRDGTMSRSPFDMTPEEIEDFKANYREEDEAIRLLAMCRKGSMTKSPFEMSASEREAWQYQVQIEARQYLYSIGQPYVTRNKNGFIVAEYADGTVTVIK